MRRIAVSFVVVVFLAMASSFALAAQRTFVSGVGSDSNACSLLAPCRSLTAALVNTAVNGEIIIQDSAGYGPVTIAQSVSIVAPPGVYGGISIASGTGITINGAGINVTLKGLTITGQGGATGIDFQAGARLRVESVEFANLTGNGLIVAGGNAETLVIDSILRDIGGAGIVVQGAATMTLDRVRFDRTGMAIDAGDGAVVHITDSRMANSTGVGARFSTLASGGSIRVSMDNCSITDATFEAVNLTTLGSSSTIDLTISRSSLVGNQNGVGVNAPGASSAATATLTDNVISKNSNKGVYVQFAGATAILSGNTVTGNVTGLQSLSSGVLTSFGNNSVTGNGNNTSPPPSIVPGI